MTSALAIVGLLYDAVDLQDLPTGVFIEIIAGIGEAPVVRGEDTVIPAAAGTLEGNRIDDFVPIELRAKITAADSAMTLADQQASHFTNLLVVRTLFKPNRERAPLVAILPGGTVMTIQARPLNLMPAHVVPGLHTEMSIDLAGDGDWVVT